MPAWNAFVKMPMELKTFEEERHPTSPEGVAYSPHEPAAPSGGNGLSVERIPGTDFNAAVYRSVLAAYAWMLLAAWIAFGRAGHIDFILAIVTIFLIIFFGIPAVMVGTGIRRTRGQQRRDRKFPGTQVDTATGPLPASEAWVQILIIPLSLALAATLIGLVNIVIV